MRPPISFWNIATVLFSKCYSLCTFIAQYSEMLQRYDNETYIAATAFHPITKYFVKDVLGGFSAR